MVINKNFRRNARKADVGDVKKSNKTSKKAKNSIFRVVWAEKCLLFLALLLYFVLLLFHVRKTECSHLNPYQNDRQI